MGKIDWCLYLKLHGRFYLFGTIMAMGVARGGKEALPPSPLPPRPAKFGMFWNFFS